jgi:hypothetical protein
MASFSSRFVLLAMVPALVAFGAGCASQVAVADTSASALAARASDGLTAPDDPADLLPDSHSDLIVAIHRRKCGACHARVEPGSVARATAESAMQRHRRRAKLTERQWEDMVDYLSSDRVTHSRPTASTR